jgi:clan AA aspartic protease (TIGR02281 family)
VNRNQISAQIILTTKYENILRTNPDLTSDVLKELPAHKNLELIGFLPEGENNGYFKVKVYGLTGYILRNSVYYDDAFYLALKTNTKSIELICAQNKLNLIALNKRKIYEESLWANQNGFQIESYVDLMDRLEKIIPRENTEEIKINYKPKETVYAPTVKSSTSSNDKINVSKVINMSKMPGGTYEIPCKVNGLALRFIFDTGASDVSISLTEALFMLKNGYLSEDDIMGKQYYSIANGEIAEGTTIRIKKLEFGGLTLNNVEASIVHVLGAPLLLGQSAISRLGKIQIDPVNSTLTIIE